MTRYTALIAIFGIGIGTAGALVDHLDGLTGLALGLTWAAIVLLVVLQWAVAAYAVAGQRTGRFAAGRYATLALAITVFAAGSALLNGRLTDVVISLVTATMFLVVLAVEQDSAKELSQ